MLSRIEWECLNVVRVDRVTHEATGGMSVETEHEKEREMVSIPERFKALLSDLVMSSSVHQHHNKQHEVPSDATRLGVVDLKGCLLADF